ncbi:MAG: hypothetical protein HZB41_15185, partial [Ignavibacteriae bacterium]|nr:hypothetical protein [Ignavibacteriota bacterium]
MKTSMKIIIINLIIYFSYSVTFSQQPPFKIQRMLTDFRGIVTNGSKTICYGDYGIMTYTTDAGKTWEQDNWGDKYNIMRMESDGSDFFGVTDYFLFRSYNYTSYWLYHSIYDEQKIIDMKLKGDSIFILTKEGIILSDKEMDVNKTPFLVLDSNSNYSELKTDGINLYFIADDTLLLIFNLDSKYLDTVNLGNYIDCIHCRKVISNLNIFNEKIYIMLNYNFNNTNNSIIARSDNFGKDWNKITQELSNIDCYKIINDSVYILNPGIYWDFSEDSYLILNYFKNDTSHYRIDTTIIDTTTYYNRIYIKDTINILDTLPQKHIYSVNRYNNKFSISDFIILNEDTIFAVGSHKMIA